MSHGTLRVFVSLVLLFFTVQAFANSFPQCSKTPYKSLVPALSNDAKVQKFCASLPPRARYNPSQCPSNRLKSLKYSEVQTFCACLKKQCAKPACPYGSGLCSKTCGGYCADFKNDCENCGGCGKKCTNGKKCVHGKCVAKPSSTTSTRRSFSTTKTRRSTSTTTRSSTTTTTTTTPMTTTTSSTTSSTTTTSTTTTSAGPAPTCSAEFDSYCGTLSSPFNVNGCHCATSTSNELFCSPVLPEEDMLPNGANYAPCGVDDSCEPGLKCIAALGIQLVKLCVPPCKEPEPQPTCPTTQITCGSDCCSAGESCSSGDCICSTSSTRDYSSDASNCGACGNQCPTGQSCGDQACFCPTSPDGDFSGDFFNCGACGVRCTPGTICRDGTCI